MDGTDRQRTLARAVTLTGIGFFTNADVTLRLQPAAADTGIVFCRIDRPGRPTIPARIENVVPAERRTAIAADGARVELIEHLMAALAGLQVDNCRIEIDGPEVPGFDGSSRPFVDAIDRAGTIALDRPPRRLKPQEAVHVGNCGAGIRFEPNGDAGLQVTYRLDYGRAAPIAAGAVTEPITADVFRERIASARTFVLQREVAVLRAAGYGRRVGAKDLLVLDDDGRPVDNVFRFADECPRHKLLDVVGDLALVGARLSGRVVAERSGHALNHALARRLRETARATETPQDRAA
ncbi:MAG: UDP-3-O-[3-hydroxymyristoyl] N-acetylglucosamine deacetylase [Planctomycetota bacterium]|nr:MAG: UDP-3-O-[3-hydroxymyristoyl] N-acetylglucosamine deacetylase [Planctomycetota bacterium]